MRAEVAFIKTVQFVIQTNMKEHCEQCDIEFERYCKVLDKLHEDDNSMENIMLVADLVLENSKEFDLNNIEEFTGALTNALAIFSSRNQILLLDLNK